MCGFSLSVALKRLFLRCLASLYIVKKFLLYSNYKCTCAYSKIQISVRMPSDVRILHIPKSQFASQVCGSLRSPIIGNILGRSCVSFGGGGGGEVELFGG